MRPIPRRSSLLLFCGLTVAAVSQPAALQAAEKFRTPARLYGRSYSIKMKVDRGAFNWVVPMWVKPDQKQSTFDASLMSLMGWTEKKFEFDAVSLSGAAIDHKKFGQAKSDWAYFPDYAKSCCAGIIGQDILKNYEVKFDPRPPAHLEWTRLETPLEKSKLKNPAGDLSGLFNLQGTIHKNRDLTLIPYTLNISENKLTFDDRVKAPKAPRKSAVFRYDFLPPVRNIEILTIPADLSASAKKMGLKPGLKVTMINGDLVGKFDRVEIDQILTGLKKDRITITLNTKKEIDFDFKKNEFVATEPVPSRSR